jgi:hypothetical protein
MLFCYVKYLHHNSHFLTPHLQNAVCNSFRLVSHPRAFVVHSKINVSSLCRILWNSALRDATPQQAQFTLKLDDKLSAEYSDLQYSCESTRILLSYPNANAISHIKDGQQDPLQVAVHLGDIEMSRILIFEGKVSPLLVWCVVITDSWL